MFHVRFLSMVAVGGALAGACSTGDSPSDRAGRDGGALTDASVPDAGNQVAETCFATTRVTAPTTSLCASSYVDLDAPYIDALCPALNTWVAGHVYRCNDAADGGERMPADAEGCTRIGPRAPGTTDWWCEPIVCVVLDPLYQSCSGNAVAYQCPASANVMPIVEDARSLPVPCTNSAEMGAGPVLCCEDN